jgi:hypothetical protein
MRPLRTAGGIMARGIAGALAGGIARAITDAIFGDRKTAAQRRRERFNKHYYSDANKENREREIKKLDETLNEIFMKKSPESKGRMK